MESNKGVPLQGAHLLGQALVEHAREAHLEVVGGWVLLQHLLDVLLQAGRSAGSTVRLSEELVDRLCGLLGELVQILEGGAVRGLLALSLFRASLHGREHPAAVCIAVDFHNASLQAEVVRDKGRLVLQSVIVRSPLIGILAEGLLIDSGSMGAQRTI